MQNGRSYLRAGVVVTMVPTTEAMLNADRRFARDEDDDDDEEDEDDDEDEDDVRGCLCCGTDISGRPGNDTVCREAWEDKVCLACYHFHQEACCFTGYWRRLDDACDSCGTDISDTPVNHTVCLECYVRGAKCGSRGRRACGLCRTSIAGRPANHTVCRACYYQESSSEARRLNPRGCVSCGIDITGVSALRASCLACYRTTNVVADYGTHEYWHSSSASPYSRASNSRGGDNFFRGRHSERDRMDDWLRISGRLGKYFGWM